MASRDSSGSSTVLPPIGAALRLRRRALAERIGTAGGRDSEIALERDLDLRRQFRRRRLPAPAAELAAAIGHRDPRRPPAMRRLRDDLALGNVFEKRQSEQRRRAAQRGVRAGRKCAVVKLREIDFGGPHPAGLFPMERYIRLRLEPGKRERLDLRAVDRIARRVGATGADDHSRAQRILADGPGTAAGMTGIARPRIEHRPEPRAACLRRWSRDPGALEERPAAGGLEFEPGMVQRRGARGHGRQQQKRNQETRQGLTSLAALLA